MLVVESLEYINIATQDINRSVEFYNLFFDFDIVEKSENLAILNFDQINIKIHKVQNTPSVLPLFSFIMDIDDFTDALQEIEKNKIKIVSGPKAIKDGEAVSILDPGSNIIELFYKE